MFYIVYKITNLLNHRYYIGRHATKNINDSYMGSGVGIINAIKKYGKENFKKEIIAMAFDRDSLWELEKLIVNEDVVKDPLSYNMAYGGKHFLHGLRQYDYDAFIRHQQKAGQSYAKTFVGKERSWHQQGGAASSRKKSEQYMYRVTTESGKMFLVNGIEFKQLCKDKNWNYNTLHWKQSMGKVISRGKHKRFLVEQICSYKKVVIVC